MRQATRKAYISFGQQPLTPRNARSRSARDWQRGRPRTADPQRPETGPAGLATNSYSGVNEGLFLPLQPIGRRQPIKDRLGNLAPP